MKTILILIAVFGLTGCADILKTRAGDKEASAGGANYSITPDCGLEINSQRDIANGSLSYSNSIAKDGTKTCTLDAGADATQGTAKAIEAMSNAFGKAVDKIPGVPGQ